MFTKPEVGVLKVERLLKSVACMYAAERRVAPPYSAIHLKAIRFRVATATCGKQVFGRTGCDNCASIGPDAYSILISSCERRLTPSLPEAKGFRNNA